MKGTISCIITLLLILYYKISFSQVVALSGKVTDFRTGKGLSGATVNIGNYGTSTNTNGDFYLIAERTIAIQKGISISFIGFQSSHDDFNGTTYNISLKPSSNTLREVVIWGNGEAILTKAIRKIPQNYPLKDCMITGVLKMSHIAKDTANYHYDYENEALIKMFSPSYTSSRSVQVSLVQKKDTLINDPNSMAGMIRWVNGYNGFANRDYVRSRGVMLSSNRLQKFTFVMNGKQWLNNSRVYVISFYSKTKSNDAGILYIDTGTYAFVRINFTVYDVKPFIFIPIQKSAGTIDYKMVNGKWYLSTVKIRNLSKHEQLDLVRTETYRTIDIDTINVNVFP